MTRIINTMRNTGFALIMYFIQIILQFALRTAFIYVLGMEFLGIESLFTNVIQVLSVAELGIGTAIGFSMYKPAAEGDTEKLKSLNALYKKVYMWISIIICVIGIALVPVLPLLMGGIPAVPINIYIIYFIFLVNSMISYFAAHKRTLLFVFQRNDIQSKASIIKLIIFKALQIAMLIITKNYYLYIILLPAGTLFECAVILRASNKLYPQINGKAQKLDSDTKKALTKNIAATSMHKISGVVVFSLDNIFISAYFGLAVLGASANYILIYTTLVTILTILTTAVQGSIGNMVAKESVEDNYKMYNTLNFGFSLLVGFCTICMLSLFQPFITSWLGEDKLLSSIVMISIVARFYISNMRSMTLVYRDCTGLMWNDRWKPFIEIITNIGLNILFITIFGLAGIFFATVVSSVLVPLWVEPFVLYKNYFKKSVWLYLTRFLVFTAATALAAAISYFLCLLLPYGFWFLAVRLAICGISALSVYLVFFGLTPESKNLLRIAKSLLYVKKKQPVRQA